MSWLYRYFDVDGGLLYVGVTDDLPQRRLEHKRKSYWFAQAVDVTTVWYPTRIAAFDAERMVVAFERPEHNLALRNRARDLQVMLVRGEIERLKAEFFVLELGLCDESEFRENQKLKINLPP